MEDIIKTRVVEREQVFIECPYCNKEIVGSTKKQIVYNLEVHIKQKHKKDGKENNGI